MYTNKGVIGIARDPRKCWDTKSETYTQSKEYLLPMHGSVVEYFGSIANSKKKIYLFDAGATYYSDVVRMMLYLYPFYIFIFSNVFNS